MIRNVIESYGFSEGMTYSFESPKAFDKLLIPKGDELRKAIEISIRLEWITVSCVQHR